MSVPKHWLLGGWYHRGLIIHQQRYRPRYDNVTLSPLLLPAGAQAERGLRYRI